MIPESSIPVLDVDGLTIAYETRLGDVEAVRDVSFFVQPGETVGLVGESGCGKTTVAFGIVDFLGPNGKIVAGSIRFLGKELVGSSRSDLTRIRGDRIAMVYQDPMQALNPSVRLGDQLAEVLTCHRKIPRGEAWERSIRMLEQVHMPDPGDVMKRYPHQISGGQQQRVIIAMAMITHPALMIMDEPTTALDVTVEAAVLDLIEELKSRFRTASIFITHNLGVMARVCDRLCVMYAGQIVETGDVGEIFKDPRHPYTMGLLASVPRLGESKADSRLVAIRGRVPHPGERPHDACIFAERCDFSTPVCLEDRPILLEIRPGHASRCFHAEKMAGRLKTLRKREEILREAERPGPSAGGPVLRVERLRVFYSQRSRSLATLLGLGQRKYIRAVDGVSAELSRGRTLGIVGESGCGKSTLVKGIIGLEPIVDGKMEFLGVNVAGPISERHTKLIQEMQMVFQNPDSTLNPSYPVGRQIARPIKRFKTVQKTRIKEEVLKLLSAVRLDRLYYDRYPRQLSGGEKQRVGIARALASRPELILCDEPVSALDVSVQAAVINLLLEIQEAFGSSMIFIAHDLSVVRYFSDDIAVMYLGQIVEMGPAEAIYSPPYHPYTEALLASIPIPDPDAAQREIRLGGNVPSALEPPGGCRFHPRCPRRAEMLPEGGKVCSHQVPPWQVGPLDHGILCHIPREELERVEPVVHPG